jgi:hypothetical protein
LDLLPRYEKAFLPPKGIKPIDFKPSNKRLKFPKPQHRKNSVDKRTLTRGVA